MSGWCRTFVALPLLAALLVPSSARGADVRCGGAVLADREVHRWQVRLLKPRGPAEVVEAGPTTASSRPTAPTWSPNGQSLAFGVSTDVGDPAVSTSSLVVVDVSSRRRTTALALRPWQLVTEVRWSPRGDRLAFVLYSANPVVEAATWTSVGDRSTVWVVKPDGSGLRPVSAGLGTTMDRGIDWAPDGHRLAYLSQGLVAVIDTDAQVPTPPPLDLAEGDASYVRWAPDGRRLAVLRHPNALRDGDAVRALSGSDTELVVMGADGSGSRVVLTGRMNSPPTWRPDGRAVTAIRMNIRDSWVTSSDVLDVDPGTAHATRLLRLPAYAYDPVWSPSGRSLALTVQPKYEEQRYVTYLTDRNGRHLHPLAADTEGWSDGASWCPLA